MALKVVLDTNILFVSISPTSAYHWIWEALETQQYEIAVSTAILLEYHEIIGRRTNEAFATQLVDFLYAARNVHRVNPFYYWNAIPHDPDDNKSFDCAVVANAEYIVTEDKHFNSLKDLPFPLVKAIDITEFKQLLEARNT